MSRLDLAWEPPGPVSAAFMNCNTIVQILNGPVGSGKTTTTLMKGLTLAQAQAPSTRDRTRTGQGIRKFRLTVVRDTYRQLWRSTLPSWWTRIPRDVGTFTGAENAPATHRVTFKLPDDTVVDFQADFVAIGDASVEDILRGYETTAFYLNELDLLAKEVFYYALTRVGRFPSMEEGGPTWAGVLADMNAPTLDSWAYKDLFEASPQELLAKGITLFRQPGGMSPDAENLRNLRPGYYASQKRLLPDWMAQRMIDNRPGYDRAGRPVYGEFVDKLHVTPGELDAMPGIPVILGLDAGLHPAAVLGQRMPNGQFRIIDELVAEGGTGAGRFGDMLGQLLKDRYEHVRHFRGWADPSAAYGADRKAGERTWIEIVAARAGIRIDAAPTNAPLRRWEAVRKPLSRLIDGEPGLLLSPRCKVLRSGFNATYRFRKVQGTERFDEQAEKNDASHPHDALQYLCSGGGGDIDIQERNEGWRRQVMARPVEHEWDPLAS